MAKILGKEEECPVIITQNIIGGKWKVAILWLLRENPKRFNELKKLLPKITQTMLTQQLRELESDGVVHRKIYHEIPPKVEYSLTPIGRKFLPIINIMGQWGNEYLEARKAERYTEDHQGS
jgi:DNA-binding HxlR family transcriptional regulator